MHRGAWVLPKWSKSRPKIIEQIGDRYIYVYSYSFGHVIWLVDYSSLFGHSYATCFRYQNSITYYAILGKELVPYDTLFVDTCRFQMTCLQGSMASWGLDPGCDIQQTHPTVSQELLMRIGTGSVKVKPNIKQFTENTVVFDDNSEETVDAVIFCTGYKITFPFVTNQQVRTPTRSRSNERRLTSLIQSYCQLVRTTNFVCTRMYSVRQHHSHSL